MKSSRFGPVDLRTNRANLSPGTSHVHSSEFEKGNEIPPPDTDSSTGSRQSIPLRAYGISDSSSGTRSSEARPIIYVELDRSVFRVSILPSFCVNVCPNRARLRSCENGNTEANANNEDRKMFHV